MVAHLKKEILIIKDEMCKDVPIDISQYIFTDYHLERLDLLSRQLEVRIKKSIERIENQSDLIAHQPAFQVTAYSNRYNSDIRKKIELATKRVDILETNASTIVNEYFTDIEKALKVSDGLRVRILTLNPHSRFVNNRAMQLAEPIARYRTELSVALDCLDRKVNESEFKDRIDLRVYDIFPTQLTFIVDDSIYSCSIANGHRSRNFNNL